MWSSAGRSGSGREFQVQHRMGDTEQWASVAHPRGSTEKRKEEGRPLATLRSLQEEETAGDSEAAICDM